MYLLYSLNIHRFPSLPSLAFGIYRSKYLKDFKVPLIGGSIFHDLRRSYTGGAVDVYKCHGKNLFTYDVNSLYPYVMMAYPVPVGIIKFFEGDITLTKTWNELFGFFQVEITAPADLKHPILQTKLQVGKNGLRTVAPLGGWTDWLFTEEIINAMKHGYTFKVIKGYSFDKSNIFEDYINDLYEIKAANHKDDPMYLIAKLLMNSLYGRFGMDNEFENHVIVHSSKLEKYTNKYNVSDWTKLDSQKVLISYIDEGELEQKQLENYSTTNISIAIASAITAYARIHMSRFKNSDDYNLYYSDTDSIVIDRPLPDHQVGTGIGLMKLENTLQEGTFIAPKVYGGIFKDDTSFTKVKGFKNNVDYLELKTLLNRDVKKLELTQEKWFRSIEQGNITIKDQIYSLQVTESKRQLVYSDNKLINTIPFTIDNNKEIV